MEAYAVKCSMDSKTAASYFMSLIVPPVLIKLVFLQIDSAHFSFS